MRTDIKHGFLITYYQSSEDSERMLSEMIETLSKENFYLVLAAHSLVPVEIQQKCDFFIYESLNISDNRQYSHGVAESLLIEYGLKHLKDEGIDWTFKVCYDVVIGDVSRFREITHNYQYDFVTCNWGNHFVCTHTFFGNVNFLLNNITWWRTVEDMFKVSNVLELCWQIDILSKNLKDRLYIYESKASFFGEHNIIDTIGYNYYNVEFWYEESEGKFYVKNNGNDYKAELRIFDYYSDTCIYVNHNFEQAKDMTHWIISPVNEYLYKAKNGFYLEIYHPETTIKKNILIKDYRWKDSNAKKFQRLKRKEVKFNEYCDFSDMSLYKELGVDISNIRNYVDIGACYGFASLPFLNSDTKIYMVEADETNANILFDLFGKNKTIKIIDKAVSDTDGTVNFYIEDSLSVVSSLFESNALGNDKGRRLVEIESISANTLIQNYIDEEEIDLLKIDIEGAEYMFFENITFDNLNKIKQLIIEFHNNEDFKVMEILKKLAKSGFKYKLNKWQQQDSEFIIENKMGIIYATK